MPPVDLSKKEDADEGQWIANHERKLGGGVLPLYRQLLEERVRRAQAKQRVNFDRSLEHLRHKAIRQDCTTYGNLADASGVEWLRARCQTDGPNGHLDRLLDLCQASGLPLMTAIWVNQSDAADGDMEGDVLTDFIAGAGRLGLVVADACAFHQKRRDECWLWGREQAERPTRWNTPCTTIGQEQIATSANTPHVAPTVIDRKRNTLHVPEFFTFGIFSTCEGNL